MENYRPFAKNRLDYLLSLETLTAEQQSEVVDIRAHFEFLESELERERQEYEGVDLREALRGCSLSLDEQEAIYGD